MYQKLVFGGNKIVECRTGGGSQYISQTGFWWK